MPELPEVETVVRSLHSVSQNASILSIKFYRTDLREKIPIELFKSILWKQTITNIFRRSKYIILQTKNGCAFFHLGMSGQFLCLDSKKPTLPHTHLVMSLKDSDCKIFYLHFVDPRRFGRISAINSSNWQTHHYISHLGIEPLEEKNLGLYLYKIGSSSKRSIKTLLMDAKIVVGIGNIYACEALFLAKIHPQKISSEISALKYKQLGHAAQKILKAAIKSGGTSIKDFKNLQSKPGYFSILLKVYGKENQPCTVCQSSINSIKQSGRSSWFCPSCQKL